MGIEPFKQTTYGVKLIFKPTDGVKPIFKSIFKPTDGVEPIFKPTDGVRPNNHNTEEVKNSLIRPLKR